MMFYRQCYLTDCSMCINIDYIRTRDRGSLINNDCIFALRSFQNNSFEFSFISKMRTFSHHYGDVYI